MEPAMEIRQTMRPAPHARAEQRQRNAMAQVQRQVEQMEHERWQAVTRHIDETSRALQQTSVVLERVNGQLQDHERRINDIEASPTRMRDWLTATLMGLSAIGSGFGCMGCLGSLSSIVVAIVGGLFWLATRAH